MPSSVLLTTSGCLRSRRRGGRQVAVNNEEIRHRHRCEHHEQSREVRDHRLGRATQVGAIKRRAPLDHLQDMYLVVVRSPSGSGHYPRRPR